MIAVARQTRKNSIAELMGVCTPEQGLFDIMFNIISQAKRFGKGEDVGLMLSLGAAGLTTLNMENP